MSSEGRRPARDAAPLLTFDGVVKRFPRSGRAAVARSAMPFGRPDRGGTLALDGASFAVAAGEVVGIIGPNGAGKSTLLKLAAGILQPTAGQIDVVGVPAAIIELGFAFHPDLTGRENLPVAAGLHGVPPELRDELIAEVIEFSGLEAFIDEPVKHYSTGMAARLGFALAIHVPSSIVLIDEVLAVGDRAFQQRCIQRVRELAAAGAAVLFVSHSLDLVNQVCDRGICINQGRVVDDGPVAEVVARYEGGVVSLLERVEDPPAVIAEVTLGSEVIESGAFLEVHAAVDVLDPSRPVLVRTELGEPLQLVGRTVNADEVDRRLDGGGRWGLDGTVGPIVVTAGKMELSFTLVEESTGMVVDRMIAPFTVTGQDVGLVRIAMHGTWTVRSSDEPARAAIHGPPVSTDAQVWCEGVGKVFVPRRGSSGLVALDGIDLSVAPGEAVGLIGPNGAGKSTLLRVLADVSEATSGRHGCRGRMASVLELGAEYHGDLTGEENLEFAWRLHGGDAASWPRAREAILHLAAIGPVLDRPVKHYSTGMKARLAVAVALESGADVLVIDEALSVGDLEFRERVRRRLVELIADGASLIFATHDLYLLGSICTRAVRLDAGRVVDDGPAWTVIANAGGAGWAGGTSVADGGILLHDLVVRPDLLDWYQPFEVEVEVEVVRPSPDVYLEFSIRNTLAADERAQPRTSDEVLMLTVCLQRLTELEDLTTTPGRKRLVGQIAGLPLLNSLDVVVGVVDRFDGAVLSEQWRTVFFGAHGASSARAEVARWAVASGPNDQLPASGREA